MSIWLKHTHGKDPADLGATDLAVLIQHAHMLTGSRPKTFYVHPDIYRQMIAATEVGVPVEVNGCKACPSYAVPSWAIAFSDESRMTQLFNYVTGEPIKMEAP